MMSTIDSIAIETTVAMISMELFELSIDVFVSVVKLGILLTALVSAFVIAKSTCNYWHIYMYHLLFSDPVLLISMETVVLTDVLAVGVSAMVELEILPVGLLMYFFCTSIVI